MAVTAVSVHEEARMREPWRRLMLAAAITVTVGVGAASAQTVIVRNAPPGSSVELVMNADTVGSATVDAAGTATITSNRPVPDNKVGSDAHLYLETCDTRRRVLMVERGKPASDPGAGCTRAQVVEWFVLRRVTTMVVDVGGKAPTLWVTQGKAPEEWLRAPSKDGTPVTIARPASKGFMIYGGGGLAKFANTVALACGTVANCTGKDSRLTYNAGAVYWVVPYFAIDASYLKPANLTVDGSDTTFGFSSFLKTDIAKVGVKVGVPVGPVRFYGQGGAAYTRATFGTTQTIIDTTITVGDVTTTVPGGATTVDLQTQGWGWYAGGGLEGWVSRSVALYVEVERAVIKGKAQGGEEGSLDERVTSVLVGLRIRIGG
jgi:hypothetical protein